MEKSMYMKMAIEEARRTMNENIGGPFGAVVVKDGKVISVASNTVLRDNDPTAHAEINAIRKACKELNTYDLTGCELYATGYPCPMCLSAIIWANVKKVYVGCMPADAAAIGFRDDFIYKFIQNGCSNQETMEIVSLDREQCLTLFEEYAASDKTVY